MQRSLFLRIVTDIENANPYFQQKRDAAGRLGFAALQKATAAIKMLAYGCSGDSIDEYLRMSESTTIQCLKKFCHTIVKIDHPP
ncbi:uncharacterized protein PGTG_20643 [Puccinia graminis f. sp. tritici CRL 75-36-700-3]|uniref:Uncharacterized protein n=1 Tax=Puccinia graminis f. sp. tritici (strain CRL 75-36-700-3 / race SCCL) TaxID=418459 RepID=H6QNU1_PUCGT|nr:uncharacterized protein PGTG_20643 [Puccinia graminis f. sp. tritici CRL 75-36-700-3]EHS62523.1 hypothetical protein PGTG_20643 [Puccinia graminis f. sp. tritici CRL 75-36-700-3]